MVPGIFPRGHPQLRWSDIVTKDLKDLNIRKELADKRVEWQRGNYANKNTIEKTVTHQR